MMAHCIVRYNNKYIIWSSILDGPVSNWMDTEDQVRAWLTENWEPDWLDHVPMLLARVKKHGTSWDNQTPEDVMTFNRVGPNDSCLTLDEIWEQYQ